MKIEKETNKTVSKYPKLNEVDSNIINNNIPRKWHRFGITSLIISLIIKSEVFASEMATNATTFATKLAGDVAVADTNTLIDTEQTAGASVVYNRFGNAILTLGQIAIFVAFACIFTKVIISTIISKVKKKEYKVGKITKVFLIILPILYIIFQMAKCFSNECF